MKTSAIPLDLFSQQERNRSRSRWVVAGFVAFFAWLGFGGDVIAYLATRDGVDGAYRHTFPIGGIALSAIAAVMAAWSWRAGATRVLWSTGAREVIDPQSDDEQRFVNVVDEMSIASGIQRPRLWIIPDDDPNALATGRDQGDAHLAVTQGLLRLLDREQLQAVVAHEIAHIRNLDVRLMTLLAALVGTVALIGDGVFRMMRGTRLTSRSSGGKRSKGGGGGALVIVLLILWIVSWLLAPLITRLLAMSVSRQREFLADASAAQFTRNPMALAAALQRIEAVGTPTLAIKNGSAHLCIADPTGHGTAPMTRRLAGWFATHPPMSDRIARLEAMAYGGMAAAPVPSAAATPPR